MRYDVENLLDDIGSFLQENINPMLSSIEAEKGDALPVSPIEEDAYFFQFLGDRVANFNQFVLYGLEGMSTADDGPGRFAAYRCSIEIVIFVHDEGNDTEIIRKLLRYQRAVIDLFQNKWNTVKRGMRFAVQGEQPSPAFKLEHRSDPVRATGVLLTTVLANG